MKLFAAILALIAIDATAQTPAGWQVMKDKKQLCQLSVPPGWTADKIMPSSVNSPDHKSSAVFSNKPADVTYADIVKMAKDMFKPAKMFEDTATRTWFSSAPSGTKQSMYAVMNTKPVCEVQVEYRDPAFEATAKQMVNSLKPAK